MSPSLLTAISAWIGVNAVVFAAIARCSRGRDADPAHRCGDAVPAGCYASLLLSRLLVQSCRVAGVKEACLLLRDPTRPGVLVPVASHRLDEGVIGRRMATGAGTWSLDLETADGTRMDERCAVALPVVRASIGDSGYLWAAFDDGERLGPRQVRLLGELAELCARALDDLDRPGELEAAIGRALTLLCADDEPVASARHAALARTVGEALGLDTAALIELELAARVQHAVPGEPAAAIRALPGYEAVAIVLRFADEHWNGTGPHGLRGNRIPLASRILAACKAIESPGSEPLRAVQGASGGVYDPAVVMALSRELLGPIPELEAEAEAVGWGDGDRMFASVLSLSS